MPKLTIQHGKVQDCKEKRKRKENWKWLCEIQTLLWPFTILTCLKSAREYIFSPITNDCKLEWTAGVCLRWWNSKTHLHLQIRSLFVSQRMALDYSLVRSSPNSATSHAKKYIYIYWESFSSLEMNSNVRPALQLFFGLVGLVVLAQEKRRERWIWEAVLNLSRRPCGTAMLWHSAPPKPHLKRHFFPGSRLLWIPMRFRVWQWIHSRRGVGGDLWPQDSDPQYWSWPTANQSEDYSPLQSCGRVPRGRK